MSITEQEHGRFTDMDNYGNHNEIISAELITDQLISLHDRYKKENSAEFFNEQKNILIHTITDRFLLGGIMAKGDQYGGNVDTIHNVRNGIYATDHELERYINRPDYNSSDYYGDPKYINKNRAVHNSRKDGTLQNGYSGDKIARNDKVNLDHVKSAKTIHDDPGRVLAENDPVDLANDDSNLVPTDESVNKSKGQKSAVEFADQLDNTRSERQARIKELSARDDLSDREKKELNKLEKLESVDTNLLRKKGAEAEKTYNRKNNIKYYTSGKFIGNTIKTSAAEGGKMALRQMISKFLQELITAVFDETRDICLTVRRLGGKWYNGLIERLKRIGSRIAGKWIEILEAGKDGMISGFCSNIVTVIINIFITTARNAVRLIREGFFSLFKAVKFLVNPPADMTKRQVFHEAGKLIISGGVITIGIMAEEALYNFPVIAAIKSIPVLGEILSSILFGLLTALAVSLALWGWDKLDLFSSKKEEQHKFVLETLSKKNAEIDDSHKNWIESYKYKDYEYYIFLKAEYSF